MKKDNTYIVHLTAEDLQQFISGQLLQLDRREAIEEHLQQCELCLLLFMQELEAHEHQTAGTDWTALENNVIAAIEAEAAAVVIGESGEPAPLVQHVEQLKQQAALAQHAEQSKQHAASAQQAVQSKQPASTRRRRTWLGRPVVQYSIAASITLLLISTGALSGLSQQVGNLAEHANNNRHKESEPLVQTSWSDEMMSKASRWLDGLHQYRYSK